jgi:hypothetical protein
MHAIYPHTPFSDIIIIMVSIDYLFLLKKGLFQAKHHETRKVRVLFRQQVPHDAQTAQTLQTVSLEVVSGGGHVI